MMEKAKRLEAKSLFVKAAEIYLQLGQEAKAAETYEKAGDWRHAEELFAKLGRTEDAARCKQKRETETNQPTWDELQNEFQQDKGNPY